VTGAAVTGGGGQMVWLASFPKSGNTWMRAIVTALSTHRHLFQVNQLGSGAQPFSVAVALHRFGLDAQWLSRDEVDRLRAALLSDVQTHDDGDDDDDGADADMNGDADSDADSDSDAARAPRLRKTHEVYRPGAPGAEPFPTATTRAAILIVRDPRDVACSYAPFFGTDLDGAIEAMGRPGADLRSSPAQTRTAQPWGSWSGHAESWLGPDVPFPVHLVRYEDLRVDAVGVLEPVFAAIGMDCTRDQVAEAVEQARFERLRDSEAQVGFREVSPKTRTFFRKGVAGGWREELSAEQVARLEHDHGEMMQRLGYELEG
jgi:aryl sulfotransferase